MNKNLETPDTLLLTFRCPKNIAGMVNSAVSRDINRTDVIVALLRKALEIEQPRIVIETVNFVQKKSDASTLAGSRVASVL